MSPPLSPVSRSRTLQEVVMKWREVPGLGQNVSQIVPGSELLSRYMESVYSGESRTSLIYIKSLQKGQPRLIEIWFSPGSAPLLGVVTARIIGQFFLFVGLVFSSLRTYVISRYLQ